MNVQRFLHLQYHNEVSLEQDTEPPTAPGCRSINGCPLLRVCVCSLLCVCNSMQSINSSMGHYTWLFFTFLIKELPHLIISISKSLNHSKPICSKTLTERTHLTVFMSESLYCAQPICSNTWIHSGMNQVSVWFFNNALNWFTEQQRSILLWLYLGLFLLVEKKNQCNR